MEEDFSIRNEIESIKASSSEDSPKDYFKEFLNLPPPVSQASAASSQNFNSSLPPYNDLSRHSIAFQTSQLQTQQILNYILLQKLSNETSCWKYLTLALIGVLIIAAGWFFFKKDSKMSRRNPRKKSSLVSEIE